MSNLISDSDYKNWLYALKENVKKSQIKASLSVNKEVLKFLFRFRDSNYCKATN